MRKERLLFAALAALAAPALLGAPPPTPTPTPAARKRKLSGGSFGTPPAPTPAAGPSKDSLADVVRKTQESSSAESAKPTRRIVITNESLGKPAPTPGGTSITISGGGGSGPVVKLPPTPAPTETDAAGPLPPYRDASGRTEEDWRERVASIREQVESAEKALSDARSEEQRLENDFYAWSDGNYRERVIRPAWDQAKERVKSLEDEVSKARTAMSDLEEEARKSGTPPGWLR